MLKILFSLSGVFLFFFSCVFLSETSCCFLGFSFEFLLFRLVSIKVENGFQKNNFIQF